MSATWGNKIQLTIFGESHGKAIGGVLSGVPAGTKLDFAEMDREMLRRHGNEEWGITTTRREPDDVKILSGVFQGHTTGTPISFVVLNQDVSDDEYEKMKDIARPSHADFTARIKYHGFQDFRGGGHSSGRLTAVLVFAGAICKQVLAKHQIKTAAYITNLAGIPCNPFDWENGDIERLKRKSLPVVNEEAGERALKEIRRLKEQGDSAGGTIEGAILNLPCGLGDPFFDSFESKLSHLLFSVPGVKGVEFGAGFSFTHMTGSKGNDAFQVKDGKITTRTNHNGGILGGMTNGMPVIFRTVLKPTPSISVPQETVNMNTLEPVTISVTGRHDACIALRAVPVVEACAALVALDAVLEEKE